MIMELTEIQKRLLAIAKPYDKKAREKAKEMRKKFRANYELGYKKGYKNAVDKACKWLLNHNDYQRVLDNGCGVRFDMTQCVMDFRKAMEE